MERAVATFYGKYCSVDQILVGAINDLIAKRFFVVGTIR